MHRESKAELTDRLRREGRFEEFKKRREQLKSEGVPAKEAWWQAAAEFPPPSDPARLPTQSRPFTKADLRTIKRKTPAKIGQIIRWAFDHLEGDWLEPRDAPSVGAWSLREWARSSPTARAEFYRLFAVKMLTLPTKDTPSPPRLTKKEREFYEKLGFKPPVPWE